MDGAPSSCRKKRQDQVLHWQKKKSPFIETLMMTRRYDWSKFIRSAIDVPIHPRFTSVVDYGLFSFFFFIFKDEYANVLQMVMNEHI